MILLCEWDIFDIHIHKLEIIQSAIACKSGFATMMVKWRWRNIFVFGAVIPVHTTKLWILYFIRESR